MQPIVLSDVVASTEQLIERVERRGLDIADLASKSAPAILQSVADPQGSGLAHGPIDWVVSDAARLSDHNRTGSVRP
ncbi:MAG: hypothetical protein ACI8Y4_003165 [Candidatus Poriferisodalaceae bacterium]|jgi:hypothetical protein